MEKVQNQYYLIFLEYECYTREIDILIEDVTDLFKGTLEECQKHFCESITSQETGKEPSHPQLEEINMHTVGCLSINNIRNCVTILFNKHEKGEINGIFFRDGFGSLLLPINRLKTRNYKTVIQKKKELINNVESNLNEESESSEESYNFLQHKAPSPHKNFTQQLIKSKIQGVGHGSCHTWKIIKTRELQYNFPAYLKMCSYKCLECDVDFHHYYAKTPDIFDAMEKCDIPNICFSKSEQNQLETEYRKNMARPLLPKGREGEARVRGRKNI